MELDGTVVGRPNKPMKSSSLVQFLHKICSLPEHLVFIYNGVTKVNAQNEHGGLATNAG